jgi:hypothetical protein
MPTRLSSHEDDVPHVAMDAIESAETQGEMIYPLETRPGTTYF